jgi:hypothetical protein
LTALEDFWSKCRFYDDVSQGDRVAAKIVNGFQAEGIGCRKASHRSDLAEITGLHYPSDLFHQQMAQVYEPFEEEILVSRQTLDIDTTSFMVVQRDFLDKTGLPRLAAANITSWWRWENNPT